MDVGVEGDRESGGVGWTKFEKEVWAVLENNEGGGVFIKQGD